MSDSSYSPGSLPTVSIIIPTFNGKAHLEECLSSLSQLDYPQGRVKIIVFDNASTDGTKEFLQDQSPNVTLLESASNLFFAPAINRAAERAETEYLALLNNDMRVEPNWLAALMVSLTTQETDCAASTILDWEGRNYQFVGGGINFLGQGFEAGGPVGEVEPSAERLLFACGGAMAIRKDLFLQLGGFDEDYELLYEDVDLGWRLNLLGYHVRLCPQARVFHKAHASVSLMDVLDRVRILERNALFTIAKNYGADLYGRLLPLALLLAERRASIFSKQAHESSNPEKIGRLIKRKGRLKHKGEAIHAALGEVAEKFCTLLEKRKALQSLRVRSDEDIIPLFKELTRPWAYEEDDHVLLEEGGYPSLMRDLFEQQF